MLRTSSEGDEQVPTSHQSHGTVESAAFEDIQITPSGECVVGFTAAFTAA
jgi:hypothetical protein